MKKFKNLTVHFIGIGGISMSALAKELALRGATVSGSDLTHSDTTTALKKQGITVFLGHDEKHLPSDADLVVKNSAIKSDNPELAAARNRGIEVIDRARLLSAVMQEYKSRIAIAGMHGKTTATGLMSAAFSAVRPTVHIGGELVDPQKHTGKGDIFITEACEYYRNFLHLTPTIAVVLNIDEDHLDYFSGITDIKNAFQDFCASADKIIINADDPHCKALTHQHIITFGTSEADYQATDITSSKGKYSFSVQGTRINLNIFGRHQVYNALAAFATADQYGIPKDSIKHGLENFRGIKRRFQLFEKKLNEADVVLDYAHHPKEIRSLIKTAKEMVQQKLHIVFQPHTYSRTERLLEDFAACFDGADTVTLMPVYAARERPGKVDSVSLLEAIKERGDLSPPALYIESGEKTIAHLKQTTNKNDTVLLVGAGDIIDICKYI